MLPLLALVAGAVSVTTPCCLPMIPAYLSYISAAGEESPSRRSKSAVRAALLFVAGFGVVFTALGASLGLVGPTFVRLIPQVERVAGVFIIAIGVHLTGLLPPLGRRRAPSSSSLTSGTAASGFVLGMAFAIGFIPTLGPVLATVFTLASGEATVVWGAVLLALYSVGFGIPYIAMALGLQRATHSLRWLQRNLGRLQAGGGVLLVGVGLLFVTGTWRTFFIPVAARLSRLGWPPL